MKIERIKLTAEEQKLYDAIQWDAKNFNSADDALLQTLDNVHDLTVSLLDRDAISQVRLDYLTDPDRNFSDTRKSKKEVFEENGNDDHAMLQHPKFVRYLWYFIHGPKLSKPSIGGFCKIIEEGHEIADVLRERIGVFVRDRVRKEGRHADADEFANLACETGRPDLAEYVRKQARAELSRARSPRG